MPRPASNELQSFIVETTDHHGKTIHIARVRWRDKATGKLKTIERKGRNRSHAKQLLDQLKAKHGTAPSNGPRTDATFSDLATQYLADKVTEAVIVDGRKVSGFKHPAPERIRVKRLVSYWGNYRLKEITARDIEQYKAYLYKLPTKHKKQRKPADVNHFLRRFRHMLNYAISIGWLDKSPIEQVENYINAADEIPRSRPEKPDELDKLLNGVTNRTRYLRVWIALAAETAARPNEINGLTLGDLFFEQNIIRLRVSTTKTQRERFVPMPQWVKQELLEWIEIAGLTEPTEPLFLGIKGLTAWRRLKERVGLQDVQRRDLRHWATTRMLKAMSQNGYAPTHTMIVTGHTVERTFRRYVDSPETFAAAAAEAINKAREASEKSQESEQPD